MASRPTPPGPENPGTAIPGAESARTRAAGTGSRIRRTPLSRAAVLTAAVALADEEGIGAVNMRHLADGLGVVPMALYKHVGSKEDLLDGMVDIVIGEFAAAAATEPAGDSADWKAQVRAAVRGARRVVAAHPWVRETIETRTIRTPAVLDHMEAVTRIFLMGGLTPDLTHHAMHTLGNRIWGFSPELFNERPTSGEPARRTTPDPDPANYPGIMAIAADAAQRRPGAVGCDEEFEFDFALDLILEAVERLASSGWESRR